MNRKQYSAPQRRDDHNYQQPQRVDRDTTCPFLVRVFYKQGSTHTLSQFEQLAEIPQNEQLLLHSWMDATLREISEHIQREIEVSRKRDTQLEFSLVYQDFNGHYRRKHLGQVKVGHMGGDDLKNLQVLRYKIGDYLSVAILEPKEEDTRGDKVAHHQHQHSHSHHNESNRQRSYHQANKNDARTSTRYERSERGNNKDFKRPQKSRSRSPTRKERYETKKGDRKEL